MLAITTGLRCFSLAVFTSMTEFRFLGLDESGTKNTFHPNNVEK